MCLPVKTAWKWHPQDCCVIWEVLWDNICYQDSSVVGERFEGSQWAKCGSTRILADKHIQSKLIRIALYNPLASLESSFVSLSLILLYILYLKGIFTSADEECRQWKPAGNPGCEQRKSSLGKNNTLALPLTLSMRRSLADLTTQTLYIIINISCGGAERRPHGSATHHRTSLYSRTDCS